MTYGEAFVLHLLPLLRRHVPPEKWAAHVLYYFKTLEAM